MGLLVTMTYDAATSDATEFAIDNTSVWGSSAELEFGGVSMPRGSVHHAYVLLMSVTTVLFLGGLVSIAEIIDRVSVTPKKTMSTFVQAAGQTYFMLPRHVPLHGLGAIRGRTDAQCKHTHAGGMLQARGRVRCLLRGLLGRPIHVRVAPQSEDCGRLHHCQQCACRAEAGVRHYFLFS